MPFNLIHEYLDREFTTSVSTSNELATVRCSLSGDLPIRFPGKLLKSAWANYSQSTYNEDRGRWDTKTPTLHLTLQIRTPDGQPFTADHVTLNDLRRFRDLRGTSQGAWTFHLHGESQPIPVDPETSRVQAGKGGVRIAVEETVTSRSAPPLVADTLMPSDVRSYDFDLFRVGTLVARAMTGRMPGGVQMRKALTLYDPDGAAVATGRGDLRYPVALRTLDKSRDADGNPRLWSLEASESPGAVAWGGVAIDVSATVIAQARISTAVLQRRINAMIGENGEKVSITGEMRERREMQGTDLVARLVIHDEIAAETIDMHGLLDSVIDSVEQDDGVTKDIAVGVAYNLARMSRDLGYELHVSLYDIKVSHIRISIGASERIQPPTPALKIDVGVEGHAVVKIGGMPLATVKIRHNRIRLEAALRLEADGSFAAATWIQENPVDVAVHWTTAVATALATAGFATVTAVGVAEFLEDKINSFIQNGFRTVVEGAMNKAPHVLAVTLGDDFTYRGIGMQGEDIVFDYVAPLEPDPRPSKEYVAIMGRSVMQMGPFAWRFMPPTLGDTWSAQNLAAKVDHIVVVMMENRSFNHVLGYRAQLPGLENSDGLTAELWSFLESQGFPIGKLNQSIIPVNEVHLKTQFPAHVGHYLDDVTQQLSVTIQTPAGRTINSPQGFLDNFRPRGENRNDVTVEDVLGYYEADDLPFFKFLAENYAYCERYFCSHPGPTLPNRMFSLTGDVQYDRTGEPILDNNNGDNFYLSRALTIFDLLTRKGVRWRVYESSPSVTMLRMFARYAGDNSNIVPLGSTPTLSVDRLQADVAAGDLPAVTVIDPAMHHHPQNDDHPIADMYRGQLFLKSVYDTLRSNEALWSRTMLIITYDEHGGFYDHVIPPLAEALRLEPMATEGPIGGHGGGFTPATMMIGYGVRVPTFVVSPWTPAGKGPDLVLDHCSILKTILACFLGTQKPFLSNRVHASRSFDAYLSAADARLDVPASPAMAPLAEGAPPRRRAIITDVLSRAQMRRGNVDFHDLTGRFARQLGR